MIRCKDCEEGLEHCDFCLYAIHEFEKDKNGRIYRGGPVGCQLYTDLTEYELEICDDFHCFREPWVGGKE